MTNISGVYCFKYYFKTSKTRCFFKVIITHCKTIVIMTMFVNMTIIMIYILFYSNYDLTLCNSHYFIIFSISTIISFD